MNQEVLLQMRYVFGAIFYSFLGLLILGVAFKVFDRMTPGELWIEIVREKNLPLAIVTGAMTLAIAQIIASAIHG
jgi:hypothetical protein